MTTTVLRARQSVDELLTLWKGGLTPLSRAILAFQVRRLKDAHARYKQTGDYEHVKEYAYKVEEVADHVFAGGRTGLKESWSRDRLYAAALASKAYRHAQERARWGTSQKPVYQAAYRIPRERCYRTMQVKGQTRLCCMLARLAFCADIKVKLLKGKALAEGL